MKHIFFGQHSENDREARRKDWALEFIVELPEDQKIIVHSLEGGMLPPIDISCDHGCDFAKIDKTRLYHDFLRIYKTYRYNPFVVLGGDFAWQNAKLRFPFMDNVLNMYDNMRYALTSEYIEDFESRMKDLPTYQGDFFVYQEKREAPDYYSGFYTTKPDMKKEIRKVGKYLRAVKNLLAYVYINLITNIRERLKLFSAVIEMSQTYGIFMDHHIISGKITKMSG